MTPTHDPVAISFVRSDVKDAPRRNALSDERRVGLIDVRWSEESLTMKCRREGPPATVIGAVRL